MPSTRAKQSPSSPRHSRSKTAKNDTHKKPPILARFDAPSNFTWCLCAQPTGCGGGTLAGVGSVGFLHQSFIVLFYSVVVFSRPNDSYGCMRLFLLRSIRRAFARVCRVCVPYVHVVMLCSVSLLHLQLLCAPHSMCGRPHSFAR